MRKVPDYSPATDLIDHFDGMHPVARSFGQPLTTWYMSHATAEDLDRRFLDQFVSAPTLRPSCDCGWVCRP